MTDSILDSTKKILGLATDYSAFDLDILTHINSTFMTLNQLGIGADGFQIEDASATWDDFLGANAARYSAVKSYVYLCLRLIFDPPQTSYLLDALNKQKSELEWRLNVQRESYEYITPAPTELDTPDDLILDGGSAYG